MPRRAPGNDEIADVLDRVADLLEAQEASRYRVAAYRGAAATARAQPEPLAALVAREGREGLEALPGIGRALSARIAELVRTGGLAYLERLEGEAGAEVLFASLPGVGPRTAARLHRALDVDTLEELEVAAHDGRLEALPGIGRRRAQAIRNALEHVLGTAARRRARRRGGAAPTAGGAPHRPPVATLLAVDAAYREAAAHGRLRRIAPRRFNPEHRAWLPILHVERDGWHLTALFSNTARAHELGRTDDWVVVYGERDGEESQHTVVTEAHGPLAGRRVVRGREAECARHDAHEAGAGPAPP